MLLQHFTWQQFLIAATILTAVWYGHIGLLFYRQQIQDFLKGRRQEAASPERLKHAWEDDYEDAPEEEADDLVGKSSLPEGMSKVGMSMFGFAPRIDEAKLTLEADEKPSEKPETTDLNNDEIRERQQKLVPDAIEELKTIFHVLDKDKGGKAEFISLFGLVSDKYAALRDTPSERALNEYIRENALFPISDEELTNLWK